MRRHLSARVVIRILLVASVLSTPGNGRAESSGCSASISPQDATAVRAVIEAYRTSWLRGDEKGVLDTLAPEAVLLPAHGAAPVLGIEAIKKYWWPAGAPAATITKLDITVEGLRGDCRIAYAHGHDDVAWTMVENGATRSYGHPGTYLDVVTKMPDGSWRIARHMWDDGPSR